MFNSGFFIWLFNFSSFQKRINKIFPPRLETSERTSPSVRKFMIKNIKTSGGGSDSPTNNFPNISVTEAEAASINSDSISGAHKRCHHLAFSVAQ